MIYLRFGQIPKDEKSRKGNGLLGDGFKSIGFENGVSVWNAVRLNDGYHLVAPLKANSSTVGDFNKYAFPENCLGLDKEQKIFVVTGEEVGRGSDNEPLLKNIKILEELPYDYFRFGK